jgi:hypothetical protein
VRKLAPGHVVRVSWFYGSVLRGTNIRAASTHARHADAKFAGFQAGDSTSTAERRTEAGSPYWGQADAEGELVYFELTCAADVRDFLRWLV